MRQTCRGPRASSSAERKLPRCHNDSLAAGDATGSCAGRLATTCACRGATPLPTLGLTRLDGSPGTPRKAAVSRDGSGFCPDEEGCSAGRGSVLFVAAEEVPWPRSEVAREPPAASRVTALGDAEGLMSSSNKSSGSSGTHTASIRPSSSRTASLQREHLSRSSDGTTNVSPSSARKVSSLRLITPTFSRVSTCVSCRPKLASPMESCSRSAPPRIWSCTSDTKC
mmetsp:Transcript_42233/g.137724  ORF Transcript_42233/g.137724 Transcript_42233/m.137724 type:complete len:225 (+) Transcript_42233:570-1244(+)